MCNPNVPFWSRNLCHWPLASLKLQKKKKKDRREETVTALGASTTWPGTSPLCLLHGAGHNLSEHLAGGGLGRGRRGQRDALWGWEVGRLPEGAGHPATRWGTRAHGRVPSATTLRDVNCVLRRRQQSMLPLVFQPENSHGGRAEIPPSRVSQISLLSTHKGNFLPAEICHDAEPTASPHGPAVEHVL